MGHLQNLLGRDFGRDCAQGSKNMSFPGTVRGPIENDRLSNAKMPDYKYVQGENLVFLNSKDPKIETDGVVHFIVIGRQDETFRHECHSFHCACDWTEKSKCLALRLNKIQA